MMKKRLEEIRWEIWYRLRMFRLSFLHMDKPEDAKSPEQMLREIKEKLKRT